ncbi:S-layer protein domain-containing protein [Methanosarcina sp. UBA289]|uniref:S-layer protein domain-containing protein n=1 Tax=Methanosarcina sp. UBA289 TaxID=1915574 RepID=UPI0025FA7E0D|nr:S-layer protein domain-containing protein [Methanosarcina sp. UBA289]
MKKYTAFLLAAFAILISVAAYNANAADNASSITKVCDVTGTDYNSESWSNEQYPIIDLFGEKEVPLFTTNGSTGNVHVNKLAKLILDDNETYTLQDGEKLDLGNGYALEVKQINIDNEEIWFEFSKDGKYIIDQIVPANTDSNKTWTVALDNVQGENNIVVMKVYVNQLFAGAVDNIVRIDGIWLIDYANATTLKVGDKIGEFTLENIVSGVNTSNMGGLVFENTTGSSVACNVVGTNYKCDSWSNAAADTADTANTANTANTADTTSTADIANTEDNVSNITDVCNVVSTSYKWVSNEQYPVIDLFGDKYVPLFTTNGSIWDAHVNKIAKLILDSNERHVLKDGEKLDLGQGYALEAKQISIPNQQAWLEFTKDGKYVDDRIVTLNDDKNTTWNVALNNNIQGENDVIVMRVHVDSVSGLVENNILQYSCVAIDGIWLTDYSDVRTLKIGDKIGEFTLEAIISGENISNQGSLVFKNATGSSISCNVVGTNYKCDSWSNQYPSINLFGEKYFPLLANSDQSRKPYNGPIWECHVDKLAKLVFDSDEKHLLKTGEKLDLGQGYSLQIKQIDVAGDRALIEFDKDGKYVDDTIVLTYPNEHYWTCLRDNIQGEDNIPVLKVYVSKVYQDGSDSIVQIDGIWLIDYANARTLKIGDKIGESTLEKIVSGTNSSNLGSLAFKKTQAVDSYSHASKEEPIVSSNKSTSPSISWHLDFLKFFTSKFLDEGEPDSTKASNTTV